jgi:excisionase family DNA binding protein
MSNDTDNDRAPRRAMHLTLEEAAQRLGKTVRQVRYLIQTGALRADKSSGRWRIDAADLPLSEPQRAAVGRREHALRDAVERGLGLDGPPPDRYSVRDLKAFQIALPLYRQGVELLGADHAAVAALRLALVQLAQGCHRFDHEDKANAYRAGRDAASLAVCELVLTGRGEAEPLIRSIEQDLMAAFSGLLRRLERRARR